ncbi:MAG: beta-agarase, partial [Chthoniobacteraceae bacterium]
YWGKFVDVFDPEFKRTLRERLKWKEYQAAKDDPWCIGFFVDNELNWGDETSLALATLVSPAEQKAKQVFVADLTAKYKTIAALNAVWKTDHASWDALLASTKAPDVAAAQGDLETFYEKIADTYFSGIREVLKEFAPHHLYLGCRYITGTVNPIAARSNARLSDVVSFNLYTRAVSDMRAELEKAGDKPYLIGEFHFGALDRGLFHTGLIPVEDQAERAKAFTQYVSECLAHPNIVGCHWFQYSDSPTTGRLWDGENFQIGFTDVCDTPYAELIEASRAMGEMLYQKRTGR